MQGDRTAYLAQRELRERAEAAAQARQRAQPLKPFGDPPQIDMETAHAIRRALRAATGNPHPSEMTPEQRARERAANVEMIRGGLTPLAAALSDRPAPFLSPAARLRKWALQPLRRADAAALAALLLAVLVWSRA